ncbi:hypothetical protein [Kitasatospora sp. NPDC056184]|uniref:hypothetical protein n=1 Tax=Kitasatospora sp. NPDC056184 TaxID=3345738 RepID=UPI0035E14633
MASRAAGQGRKSPSKRRWKLIGSRCGNRSQAPSTPVTPSSTIRSTRWGKSAAQEAPTLVAQDGPKKMVAYSSAASSGQGRRSNCCGA